MKLIDTHLHIDLMLNAPSTTVHANEEQDRQILHIFQEAAQQDVANYITVGTNRTDSAYGVSVAAQHNPLFASVGLHPNECNETWKEDILFFDTLIRTTPHGVIVAVGECGIDLYRSPDTLTQQKDVFHAQIELALKYKLPLIIHSRNAPEETFACLNAYAHEPLRGSLHCFSYDSGYAREARSRGFVLGIGGTISYPKNQILRDVVAETPLTDMVLETDAPFLTPQPWRGTPNRPKYIRYIAEQIAQLHAISSETVAATTTATAHRIFSLQKEIV